MPDFYEALFIGFVLNLLVGSFIRSRVDVSRTPSAARSTPSIGVVLAGPVGSAERRSARTG